MNHPTPFTRPSSSQAARTSGAARARASGAARVLAVLACVIAGSGGYACSFAPSDARIGVDAPSYAAFTDGSMTLTSTADFLEHRCGSLDCHGSPQRNFQIWGCNGQRIVMDGGPFMPGCRASGGLNTTQAEYSSTFRSLVALEPTVMSEVVQHGGQNPDALTFVRKARGEESHKGGMLVTPGDPQDVCMTAWLTGTSNVPACATAIMDFP